MRKTFLFTVVLLFATAMGAFAQSTNDIQIDKSKIQLHAGSGFYSGGFPVYAFADFNISPDWTVGPQVNFVFDNNFHFVLSGRADYHFNTLLNIPEQWDFYAGATMGIDFSNRTTFSSGIHVGGRWYWNKTWGLNLEIGGGTYFNAGIGVSMKL